MKWPKVVILFNILVTKCWTMTQSELEEFSDFIEKTSQLDLNLKSNTDVEADEDELIQDNAWEESGKFEGDLILNERQRRVIVENVAEGLSRNGLRDTTKRWPDNEVIYFIQREHFNDDQLQAIQSGIDDIAQASCIKFRPYKKGDRDAVVIQGSRRGCFSQVGYQGGYQVLNLYGRHPVGRGCFRHGTVVHEMLHTLGFYHMQSSPDRDDYIDVIWENILQPARHNFRKYNTFAVSDFGIGYDYESVLHYSRKAFSSNGQDTLIPKQREASIGQRIGLSDKDTQKLNKMYCDAESSNDDVESQAARRKPNKKQNSKNKPFEGQGIGYHQGKTVVIKLPAIETFRLPDKPSFHLFDYFSKAPQVMSQTFTEKNGYRGGIISSHKLVAPTPVEKKILSKVELPDRYRVTEMGQNQLHNMNIAPPVQKENINNPYMNKMFTDEEITFRLFNDKPKEFEGLNKVVAVHDYPMEVSENFKIRNDYSRFYTPKQNFNSLHKNIHIQNTEKPINHLNTNTNVNILTGDQNRTKSPIISHRPGLTFYDITTKDFIKESNEKNLPINSDDFEEDTVSIFKTSYPISKQNSIVMNLDRRVNNENLYHRNEFKDFYRPSNKPSADENWNNNYERHNEEYDVNLNSDNEENKDILHHIELTSPKNIMLHPYPLIEHSSFSPNFQKRLLNYDHVL